MSTNSNKTFWERINPNIVYHFVAFIMMAVFYLGVYKKEIDVIKENLSLNKAAIEILSKQISNLEGNKTLTEQRGINTDKTISGLDIRVTRLEETVPQIKVLVEQVNTIKETQKEMKDDTKDQLKEIKDLVQKALQK